MGVVKGNKYQSCFSNRFIKTVKETLEGEFGDEFIQQRDKEGHTALHWAALGGYNEICEILVEKAPLMNVIMIMIRDLYTGPMLMNMQ